MALVLSMRERQDFYVEDERFVVEQVYSDTHFRIRRDSTGQVFDVTDEKATEIMPDVMVSAGDKQPNVLARVAIEAPRTMIIARGDNYRKAQGVRP